MNYYNEFDPVAAAWLRELIKAGHLPAGDVDERSIEDVRPVELAGYTQCHFFAGIGGWAYALDLAGWPRDRPVWTGSCPCQPFSAAGKGNGFADERHLWPAWNHLIAQCHPPVVFGEQVASKGADAWIDLVHADLEGLGYAFGCIPFPAAGIGAPHIRDRNYWLGVGLADTNYAGLEGWGRAEERAAEFVAGARGVAGRLADSASGGRREECAHAGGGVAGSGAQGFATGSVHGSGLVGMANANRQRRAGLGLLLRPEETGRDAGEVLEAAGSSAALRVGPVNGHWRVADWLGCRDGKWRPVEPGTFPLAHGLPARVGRLRGYGNAIVPQQAAEFVKALMEVS